ncbi:MAG: alanine--glyoxylate aminotransferase family protein [Gemmatimonadota bacterium]|nr:alanine--glyoxylate aminotransferase family protein [Gemmatimonadota bacterium]
MPDAAPLSAIQGSASPSPRPATAVPFGRFFLPGPTEVRPEVLAAQLHPMIGHRGAAMEGLVAELSAGLRYVFRTKRPVYISSSSATGLMEGAVRNGARARVLSLVNGAFSERFFRIARACGLEAEPLEVPLGQVHTPEMLEQALRGGRFDAVTVVHSETSTGALNPVADLARVAHDAGDVVLLVDSVSGIAGTPVESDGWNLDFVLTGSQKALALPPGLALGVAQESVLARAKQRTDRGIYFDFIEFEKGIVKDQTPNTPALSLLYALALQLQRIREETIEGRWARHEAMARRTVEWTAEMRERGVALSLLAPEGFRSPTVSCIKVPEGQSGSRITKEMDRMGFTIAAGYGALKDATFRIGHMGDHSVAELDVLLDALAQVLAR